MALKITSECINCGACISECPNSAIYMSGESWNISQGTSVSVGGNYTLINKLEVGVFDFQKALSNDFFYIVPEKCTEFV